MTFILSTDKGRHSNWMWFAPTFEVSVCKPLTRGVSAAGLQTNPKAPWNKSRVSCFFSSCLWMLAFPNNDNVVARSVCQHHASDDVWIYAATETPLWLAYTIRNGTQSGSWYSQWSCCAGHLVSGIPSCENCATDSQEKQNYWPEHRGLNYPLGTESKHVQNAPC